MEFNRIQLDLNISERCKTRLVWGTNSFVFSNCHSDSDRQAVIFLVSPAALFQLKYDWDTKISCTTSAASLQLRDIVANLFLSNEREQETFNGGACAVMDRMCTWREVALGMGWGGRCGTTAK